MATDPRRRLLYQLDDLLEGVEQLRLAGTLRVPEQLRSQMERVATEIGEKDHVRTPTAVAAAHRRLFYLQRQLLLGSWPVPIDAPRAALTAPAGGRRRADLPPLVLPPREHSASEADWQEVVRLVVQRAQDRARFLAAQARAANRLPGADGKALAARRSDQADRAQRSLQILVGQAEGALRRSVVLDGEPTSPTSGRLRVEDLDFDLDAEEVRQAGRPVRLTRSERACLVALAANPGRVLSREAMLHLIYGSDPTVSVRTRTLDVHITHIRAKLGRPSYLESVAGVGYRVSERAPGQMAPAAGSDRLRARRKAQRRAWAQGSSEVLPAPQAAPRSTIDRPSSR